MFRRFFVGVVLFSCVGLAAASQAIPNWQAPSSWTPPRALGMRPLGVESDIAGPLPFIPITPCRQYDSRNATPLVDNTSRTILLSGTPCGIPSQAAAVSANITVFSITGAGGNGVFKLGVSSPPTTAWINYPPSETQRGNAGTMATDGSGNIVVQINQGGGSVNLTVDVNGYYAVAPANQTSTFKVVNNGGDFVPAIWGETSSTGGDASGVLGVAKATTGQTFGVDGQNLSNSDFSSGVRGSAFGLSGRTSGVYGQNSSTSGHSCGVLGATTASLGSDRAGVRGIASGGIFTTQVYSSAGVRGETVVGYGVLGISNETGVGAALIGNSDQQLIYALLAAKGPNNYAVFAGGDMGGTGAKYFVEPHPADATKVIRYVSLEGPESGTYFRGRGKFQNGLATIEVPEDFRMVTDAEGLSIQVTPIGEIAGVAVVQLDLNEILVKASRNVEFFYTVNGVRKTHKDLKPIGPGNEFVPQNAEAKIPAHLTEGQKAMLISNGTYNEDGTVNMGTAERLGWPRQWAERKAESREAAAAPRKVQVDRP